MRVLCDVHIPYRLVSRLRELGVDATHVNRILDGSETTDAAIASFVDANQMLLITKDGDFRDSHFLTGVPGRVLRLTLGNRSNTELIALVETHQRPSEQRQVRHGRQQPARTLAEPKPSPESEAAASR